MHFSERGYLLIALTGLLAIAGLWSGAPVLARLWLLPASMLAAGLAWESFAAARLRIDARLLAPSRLYLGRQTAAVLQFVHPAARAQMLEYAPATPPGFAPLGEPQELVLQARAATDVPLQITAQRLGPHRWPPLPARLLGRFALAWWSRELAPEYTAEVAPDTLQRSSLRVRGSSDGLRSRRLAGAGAELHQLRRYTPGDPLSRVDWKTSARSGQLITREFSEDQHLDVMIAIDAGRLSRVRAGALDRLGLFANIAARFAEAAVLRDDRIGLLVYAEQPLVLCPPERGAAAVIRIREQLARLVPVGAESDPLAAATQIRATLKHRSLVVLLSDLEDASLGTQLARAVRLLAPPHLALVAGVRSAELAELAMRPAVGWRDAWGSLAALEQESRTDAQIRVLRQGGTPVVATREAQLEEAVLQQYVALRRRRRI